MTRAIAIKKFVKMFHCDTARIASPCGRLFLILGWNKRSEGEWFKNGEPFNFNYVFERVIASGWNYKQLFSSARKYKQLEKE